MQTALLVLTLNALGFTLAVDTTASPPESTSEIIFHTEAIAADTTSAAQTQSSTPTPSSSACSGTANLTGLCPACNGQNIEYDEDNEYYVFCDSDYTNVTYNEIFFFAPPTLSQCIGACKGADGCYAPVIGPGGRCFQALTGPKDNPILSNQPNYAALLPRFIGSSPPPSGIVIVPPKASTTTPHSSASSKPAKQCNAADISCPRCNNVNVKDSSGTIYKVLCNNEIYADTHHALQQQLTPEECMAACNNYTSCEGATFWSNGNCELARGENVFPQTRAGRTAFLSIDPNFTPPPLQLSAFPTGPPPPALPTTAPSLDGCMPSVITCPQCDGVCLADGFKGRYSVRCDLQPICKRTKGRYNVRSAKACLKRCDAEETCAAAIYERGKCVTCQGTLESFTPYVLPHEYVIFLAEPIFLGSIAPLLPDS